MIFEYDDEFLKIRIYEDIPDVRNGTPKETIEIPDIMDAWEFYKRIVRCKECKHYDKFRSWSACTYWSGDPYEQASVNDDDFCSRGERREP